MDHWEIEATDLRLRLDDALASLASMTEVANAAQAAELRLTAFAEAQVKRANDAEAETLRLRSELRGAALASMMGAGALVQNLAPDLAEAWRRSDVESEPLRTIVSMLLEADGRQELREGESLTALAAHVLRRRGEAEAEAEAEAKRWRARCPVTAEDVREAGITWEKFDAWVEPRGFAPARRPNPWDTPKLAIVGRSDIGWVRGDTFYGEPAAWPGNRRAYGLPGEVAGFIMFVSKTDGRPAHDILAEMAAEVSP